jgi:Protein of unknown function (DUF2786)
MDRAQASRLVAKLRALAADRAATDSEKALALAKADELSTRFGLGVAEKTKAQARRRHRVRSVSRDLDWIFSASRAMHSPTAKAMHRWGDWKITIEVGWRAEPIRVARDRRRA